MKRFWADKDGGESVEWPLLVALIALVIVVMAWPTPGTALQSAITAIIGAFDQIGA